MVRRCKRVKRKIARKHISRFFSSLCLAHQMLASSGHDLHHPHVWHRGPQVELAGTPSTGQEWDVAPSGVKHVGFLLTNDWKIETDKQIDAASAVCVGLDWWKDEPGQKAKLWIYVLAVVTTERVVTERSPGLWRMSVWTPWCDAEVHLSP